MPSTYISIDLSQPPSAHPSRHLATAATYPKLAHLPYSSTPYDSMVCVVSTKTTSTKRGVYTGIDSPFSSPNKEGALYLQRTVPMKQPRVNVNERCKP